MKRRTRERVLVDVKLRNGRIIKKYGYAMIHTMTNEDAEKLIKHALSGKKVKPQTLILDHAVTNLSAANEEILKVLGFEVHRYGIFTGHKLIA